MRIQIPFLSFLSLLLFASFSHAFVGPSCMKIKDTLEHKPDIIFEKFNTEICKKGCKPVVAHYERFARKNVINPLITRVMKDMGMPQHTKIVLKLADDVFKVVKGECAKSLGKGHLCQDPETLRKFGNCLKGNLMPVVMGKIGDLMPLVAEPMCAKELAYFEKGDLWEKVIPSYIDKVEAGTE
ncbi:hypothetical protein BDV33DRAFT_197860 [Aspergillus novoparasiticus]|uniref:Saposin B-type domain-containing protein n=1 Tax=Aspergillus novoparasiticus TaxID=986946 RepID=A0A5N6F8W4_9EURO|nr:hypothetical protein BDV33DRAFT_197860 [Aspergillus novoparasiticus]